MSKFASAVPKNATAPLNENTGTGASPISGPLSASPGERFFDVGALKTYMYVKVDTGTNYALNAVAATTTIATANGALAFWAVGGGTNTTDPSNGTVVSYISYALNSTTPAYNANAVAGVFLGVVTSLNYTLIQTGGIHTAVKCNGAGLGGGYALVSDTITTGTTCNTTVVVPGTAPAYRIVGYTLGDVASSAVKAILVLDKDF